MRANLIAKHGFSNRNQLTLQLVTDGMKLTPPAPNFIQARDAIILADIVLTGGTNWTSLWTGFAKRGLGGLASVSNVYDEEWNWHDHAFEDYSLPLPTNAWSIEITGNSSAPALAMGMLFVGSSDGHLYAVSLGQQNELWEYPSNSALGFVSAPAAAYEGTVYIGTTNGQLVALSYEGVEKWAFNAGSPIESSPAVGRDNTVYFASLNGNVYAVSGAGVPLWTNLGAGPIYSPMLVDVNGNVLVGDSQGMRAIRNGTNLWISSFCEIRGASAIDPSGFIFAGATNNCLYALHPSSGTIVWSTNLGAVVVGSPVIGAPYIIGENTNKFWNLYVATAAGTLWAFQCDPNRRTNMWTLSLPSVSGGLAMNWNETIYSGGQGALFVITNGSLAFTHVLGQGEDVTSPPAIGPDGALYFTTNQKLYARRLYPAPPGLFWPIFQRDARRLGNAGLVTMEAQRWSTNTFQFTVENPLSPTGTIMFSSDLTNWQSLGITVPALDKYQIADPNATNAFRFYRVAP